MLVPNFFFNSVGQVKDICRADVACGCQFAPLLKAKREGQGSFKVLGRKVAGAEFLRQHTRRY